MITQRAFTHGEKVSLLTSVLVIGVEGPLTTHVAPRQLESGADLALLAHCPIALFGGGNIFLRS